LRQIRIPCKGNQVAVGSEVGYPDRMGAVAAIIKIDADILNLKTKLLKKGEGSTEAQARMNELLKKRQQLLLDLEKQSRERIR